MSSYKDSQTYKSVLDALNSLSVDYGQHPVTQGIAKINALMLPVLVDVLEGRQDIEAIKEACDSRILAKEPETKPEPVKEVKPQDPTSARAALQKLKANHEGRVEGRTRKTTKGD